MSRRTRTALLRSLSLAGILTAVALVAPPIVHGQDGEHALLNQNSGPAPSVAAYDVPGVPVDGGRALLGHFSPEVSAITASFELLASDTLAQAIDGAQALTGRRSTFEARRRSVSANQ